MCTTPLAHTVVDIFVAHVLAFGVPTAQVTNFPVGNLVYKSLVQHLFDYCSSVYMSRFTIASKTELQVLQNKFAIVNLRNHMHSNALWLHRPVNWLDIISMPEYSQTLNVYIYVVRRCMSESIWFQRCQHLLLWHPGSGNKENLFCPVSLTLKLQTVSIWKQV